MLDPMCLHLAEALLCMLSDNMSIVYSLCFMYLGGSALYGGLLVPYSKIPGLARIIYFTAVPAVTQRALLINDFMCCYLTFTCDDVTSSFPHEVPGNFSKPGGVSSTNLHDTAATAVAGAGPIDGFCPPDLQATADGTQAGNLGRLYLEGLDLMEVDNYILLFTLFCVAVGARVAASVVLKAREAFAERLIEVDTGVSRQRLIGLIQGEFEYRGGGGSERRDREQVGNIDLEGRFAAKGVEVEMASFNLAGTRGERYQRERKPGQNT
ncbi:unnamed protein product [Choristocarpus tenellus]